MATKYDLFVSNVMASLRCLCCSQTHTKVVVPDQRIVCVIVPRLDPSTFAFFNDERLSVYRRNCKKLTKGYMIGSMHASCWYDINMTAISGDTKSPKMHSIQKNIVHEHVRRICIIANHLQDTAIANQHMKWDSTVSGNNPGVRFPQYIKTPKVGIIRHYIYK